MLRQLGRERDLVVLHTRPPDAPADWKPAHIFNFLDDPHLPYTRQAQVEEAHHRLLRGQTQHVLDGRRQVLVRAAPIAEAQKIRGGGSALQRRVSQNDASARWRGWKGAIVVSQLTVAANGHNGTGHASVLLARLRDLRKHLVRHIKGQDHIMDRVCSVLTRGELGLAHPRRPRGSFLFVGPTGVGKTETTNVFTDYLYDGAAPIRFDMSEYQNKVSVEKLIGESRNDPGLLGRALRGVTRGTLLFDELEKAHPLVLDLFLQVVEDARLSLATGEVLDLRSFYVVFTSNIGSEETMRMESAPFASVERTMLMRVRERLRPELLGRINEVVIYARLSYATQREICEEMIVAELARLRTLGHQLEIDSGVVEFLVRQGYHRTFGARPMRGVVERFLQDAISDDLLAEGNGSGIVVEAVERGRLTIVRSPGT